MTDKVNQSNGTDEDCGMRPVWLRDLEAREIAYCDGNRVYFCIDRDWCAPEEDRLGFAGLARLVECVRQFHWHRDVEPSAGEHTVDSITRSLEMSFLHPIHCDEVVYGEYTVIDARRCSYKLSVSISDKESDELLALCQLDFAFYGASENACVAPPVAVIKGLRALSNMANRRA
jgi:acyl-CoA thioesterase FadM